MISISFVNVLYLLIAIPLLALIVVPFCIAIRKDNRSVSVVTSFILHIVMVGLIALSAAGTTLTAVITKTQVYVVADVSFSTNSELETVDDYIREVKSSMPRNSKMGVVCFGADYELHTELGDKFKTVSDTTVNREATNVKDALDYTATLFSDDVIKKIVLITDGKLTDTKGMTDLIGSVERLHAQNIQIDAMYVDSNIKESAKEVQVTSVDYTKTTYLNKQATADVMLDSNQEVETYVSLKKDGVQLERKAVGLTKGLNVVNFNLPTQEEGEYAYSVTVETSAGQDENTHNNTYSFTQRVLGKASVLLITNKASDYTKVQAIYGANADIERIAPPRVPYTVESLCKYDEIVLSDVDVSTFDNHTSFIDSLNTVVSKLGKSLLVMGDTQLQNKVGTSDAEEGEEPDPALELYRGLLPTHIGNVNQDKKLVTIVLDTSRSMENASFFIMAQQIAIGILENLSEQDSFAIITFWGENNVLQTPVQATKENVDAAIEKVKKAQCRQGTLIGEAMQKAFSVIGSMTSFGSREVMLITDGSGWGQAELNPPKIIADMYSQRIITSVVNVCGNTNNPPNYNKIEEMGAVGGGKTYYIDPNGSTDVTLSGILDDLAEKIIEVPTKLNVEFYNDDVLEDVAIDVLGTNAAVEGLNEMTVNAFVNNVKKEDAVTVLTANYLPNEDARPIAVPIYSYINVDKGRVAYFASSFDWTSHWQDESAGMDFYRNMFNTNVPDEKVDYPFEIKVSYDGAKGYVEILPLRLNATATVKIAVDMPNGTTIEDTLRFQTNGYTYSFDAKETGKYTIHMTYVRGDAAEDEPVSVFFDLSYSPEYNSFLAFDVSEVHQFIRHRGQVTTDGTVDLSNSDDQVATYTIDFTIPFAAAVVILFVIDIIIRKLKWSDIKGLFKKQAVNIRKGD